VNVFGMSVPLPVIRTSLASAAFAVYENVLAAMLAVPASAAAGAMRHTAIAAVDARRRRNLLRALPIETSVNPIGYCRQPIGRGALPPLPLGEQARGRTSFDVELLVPV
jgi:hypothetical protein